MLVGVAFLPPLQNIGILHHKKAKLRKHMRQSVLNFVQGIFCEIRLKIYFFN